MKIGQRTGKSAQQIYWAIITCLTTPDQVIGFISNNPQTALGKVQKALDELGTMDDRYSLRYDTKPSTGQYFHFSNGSQIKFINSAVQDDTPCRVEASIQAIQGFPTGGEVIRESAKSIWDFSTGSIGVGVREVQPTSAERRWEKIFDDMQSLKDMYDEPLMLLEEARRELNELKAIYKPK